MSWSGGDSGVELAITIPSTGDVSINWAVRLSSLNLPNHIVIIKETGSLDLARERAVEDALSYNPNWIMTLDSDVLPPKNAYQLLARNQLDFVSGLYFVDKEHSYPAAWIVDNGTLTPLTKYYKKSIMNVDAVGLGCTMIRPRVFEDIERPWFRWTEGYEKHPWDMRDVEGENAQIGVGEDFYFCHKAQEAGYNVYLDTTVSCGHELDGVMKDGNYLPRSSYNKKKTGGQ